MIFIFMFSAAACETPETTTGTTGKDTTTTSTIPPPDTSKVKPDSTRLP